MSNTSNYSYPKKLEITALDMIDRDIKRVEDKVEKNKTTIIAQAELVARNEGRIEMLSKCWGNSGYLQSEIDEPLEGKVDKQEGYSLIPEEYLQQIGELKEAVALQKEYIDELRE